MRAGFGYGYNCAVVFDPPMAGLPDGKGEFFWDGAAGTWFWVDPTNDVVFVGMIQRMLGPGVRMWSIGAGRRFMGRWWSRRSKRQKLKLK